MNKHKLFYLVAGVVIFLSGFYLGNRKGEALCSDVSSTFTHGAIVELKGELALLRHLRNGDINKTETLLEYLVDNNVNYLYSEIKMKEVNQPVDREIIDAIKEAKKYREEYPFNHPVKGVAIRIEEAFSSVGE